MNETNKILTNDEKIVLEAKPVYTPYIISSIIGLIILMVIAGFASMAALESIKFTTAIVIAIFIIGLVVINLSYKQLFYTVTNKRIIIQSGIIGRDFKSINFPMIQNLSASVGLIGVIFKVGTVNIFTGEMESVSNGQNGSSMQSKYDKLHNVNAPYDVIKQIQEAMHK